MPDTASQFAFTHWNRLKRFHRVPAMTSVSENREDRTWFMLKVLKGSQAASAMDKAFFRYQAENWGWDSTDLQWEAEGQFDNLIATVYVLRFRADFDFAPLITLLNSLEFQTSQYGGVTIYSVPLTADVLWSDRSNLAQHNKVVGGTGKWVGVSGSYSGVSGGPKPFTPDGVIVFEFKLRKGR
ncbi:MAG: hypothetical protein HF973_14730 [Chloroflexi bacterium]|nr:hypothetical protein [Chloroflexota bacterium]